MVDLEALPSGLKEVVKDGDGGLEVSVYYLECLAQATYVIAHQDKAFIVDPRRDVDCFISELASKNRMLLGILETHFHADFVSGHYELMQKTGATIYFGPTAGARCQFPHHELKDEEIINFTSRYHIKVLSTPGHTLESVVYQVIDVANDNKSVCAFTGDTLFIGSCGRPDLVGSLGCTAQGMAEKMYSTLKNKLCTLPDDTLVFPAHGAGSPCGKNLSSDLHSTIGKEKLTNPALQYDNEEEFVKFLTEGQPVAPGYFSHDVATNILGAHPLDEELSKVSVVSAEAFKAASDNDQVTIIDTRQVDEYNKGFIAKSLNFPLGVAGGTIVRVEDGNFAMWVGTLLTSDTKLLLITEPTKEGETLQRLARIGYTNVACILEDGITAWKKAGYPVATAERIDLIKGQKSLSTYITEGYQLIDVRTLSEHKANTAQGAINIPLTEIYQHLEKLDKTKRYVAFCSSGYRSVVASSILRAKGFDVQDIYGGFAAVSVSASELTTSGKICPSMSSLIDKLTGQSKP